MTEIETIIAKAGHKIRDFAADQSGATAIEYALVAAGVGVAVAGAISAVGSSVKTTLYDKLASMFQ